MGSEPDDLYPIIERDLYVFVTIAGLWLQTREPAVRKTYDILRDCGISASMNSVKISIRKLVNVEWLKPRPYGENLHRYVPTMRGFAEYASHLTEIWKRDEYYCLRKHVDVAAVDWLASGVRHAVWIYDEVMKWSRLLPDLSVQAQIREIARAVEEARPVDEVPPELLEWIRQEAPALRCSYMRTVVLRVNAMFDAYLEMDEMTPEAYELSQALTEVVRKLEKYCASKGVKFDDEESGEDQQTASELQNT